MKKIIMLFCFILGATSMYPMEQDNKDTDFSFKKLEDYEKNAQDKLAQLEIKGALHSTSPEEVALYNLGNQINQDTITLPGNTNKQVVLKTILQAIGKKNAKNARNLTYKFKKGKKPKKKINQETKRKLFD